MSRVGNAPVNLPAGVDVKISEDNVVTVKGPKGELTQEIDKSITIKQEDNTLVFTRKSDNKEHRSLHGLSRSLVQNMVTGVTEGFEKRLEIVGVGYRAQKQGKKLVLTLGYSHPVEMEDPTEIETVVEDQTKIVVKGIDKQVVGAYAANIRDKRRPEPYKGKGVRYADEFVRIKEGKSGK